MLLGSAREFIQSGEVPPKKKLPKPKASITD
nr:MAG TPA: hypothetical protein [Caudoviricetes sp.]